MYFYPSAATLTTKIKLRSWSLYLFLVVLILLGGLLSCLFLTDEEIQKYSMLTTSRFVNSKISMNGYTINTPGCRIPEIKPFDESVSKYIFKPPAPRCNFGKPALIGSNNTSIFFIEDSLQSYQLHSISDVQCCYQEFRRIRPALDQDDNKIMYENQCTKFTDNVTIESKEFIRVSCKDKDNSPIYHDYFAFVPLKFNVSATKKIAETEQLKLNVLVIGLDGLSRVNLHRQMPKTIEYLTLIDGVELLGYNKIADNTFPNVIPILTGMLTRELTMNCWPTQNSYFDACYFLWQDYNKKGYVTAFGEDAAWLGLFNHYRRGFMMEQPTNYFYGYFNREAETRTGNSKSFNGLFHCVGAREVYKDFLEYIWRFGSKMEMEKLPYFAFFWGSSLTHDYLNRPSLGDESYYQFFKKLKESGHLNNTAMFVISDHGLRFGDVRQTYQGRMEDRLPFVVAVLPDWFKQKYQVAYANMKTNARRLTTPLDLHETLKDLLDPAALEDDKIGQRSRQFSKRHSLFTEISNQRTCDDADIEAHWCSCQHAQTVSVHNTLVQQSAHLAVQDMNKQLSGYAQCAELTLAEVSNAQIITYSGHVKDVIITLKTVPGGGIFEATVRRRKIGYTRVTFEVIGTISRLNLYGEQSSCITDYNLKLYCYCRSLLSILEN